MVKMRWRSSTECLAFFSPRESIGSQGFLRSSWRETMVKMRWRSSTECLAFFSWHSFPGAVLSDSCSLTSFPRSSPRLPRPDPCLESDRWRPARGARLRPGRSGWPSWDPRMPSPAPGKLQRPGFLVCSAMTRELQPFCQTVAAGMIFLKSFPEAYILQRTTNWAQLAT